MPHFEHLVACGKAIGASAVRAHCNMLQHAATYCNNIGESTATVSCLSSFWTLKCLFCWCEFVLPHSFWRVNVCHCSTLQHTDTQWYKLHTRRVNAYHCNILQHTASLCKTLQHAATTATHHNTLLLISFTCHCLSLQHAATRCNTLNTLQHTATRYMCDVSSRITECQHILTCVCACVCVRCDEASTNGAFALIHGHFVAMQTHKYTHTQIYIYIYMYIDPHIYSHTYTWYICGCMYIYTCTYVYRCARIHICTHIYIHVYIYMLV